MLNGTDYFPWDCFDSCGLRSCAVLGCQKSKKKSPIRVLHIPFDIYENLETKTMFRVAADLLHYEKVWESFLCHESQLDVPNILLARNPQSRPRLTSRRSQKDNPLSRRKSRR